MESNENIIKAMEICAKPGCGMECPYLNKGAGAKSCRAVLLEDALAELVGLMADKESLNYEVDNLEASASAYRAERDKLREGWHDLCEERDKLGKECEELKEYALALEKEGQEARADRDKLRAENKTLNAEMDDLEAANHTLRAERDTMRLELEETRPALKAARTYSDILHQRCHVQQNEIDAMVLKLGKQEEKTDRRSVGFDGSTAYWCGRADALAEVVGHMFEGEAPCK